MVGLSKQDRKKVRYVPSLDGRVEAVGELDVLRWGELLKNGSSHDLHLDRALLRLKHNIHQLLVKLRRNASVQTTNTHMD